VYCCCRIIISTAPAASPLPASHRDEYQAAYHAHIHASQPGDASTKPASEPRRFTDML
jgi:hypothetical protein